MKTIVKIKQVDENLIMRIAEIQFPANTMTTPLKSAKRAVPIDSINEIFRMINLEKIRKINMDSGEERKSNTNLLRDKRQDVPNLFFLSYSNTPMPNKKELGALVDLQYVHSDAAVIPLWPGLTKGRKGEKLKETYLDFVRKYIEIVETLNNKSIIGTIPVRLARQFVPDLLKLYHAHDITSFVIDSDGASVYTDRSWIRMVQREIYNLGIRDEGFVYNINSGEGRFMKNADVILARDFITIPFGIDILGNNHIPPRLDTAGWRKIKASRYKGPRLFDSSTYGYSRVQDLVAGRKKVKNENIRRQFYETINLQNVIKEENTAFGYLKKKQQVKEHKVLSDAETLKKDLLYGQKQKSLFDAF